jgi:enterochelin esterase-like enzyme
MPAQNNNNNSDEDFPLSPESLARAEGVEAGETLSFPWDDSKIFPGTRRVIRVYVPRAYDGKTPACVAVFQDGGGYRFETVFDNLIHGGEMPVTIGVIVPPGSVPGAVDPSGVRHNRTFEYDSPGDRYARFLLEEILPAAERLKTADGRRVLLSKKGADRMIAGGSSGAAAAFNAAWAMPGEFPRVFSAIGSYTGLRGSHIYPTLIHKTEPKPMRIFLQSGTRDMWTSFGDWWSANNAMVRALTFAGYDFEHAFGDGKHSAAHGAALFPKAMRFLWKDWPAPVSAGVASRNHVMRATIFADKRWETLPGAFSGARHLRSDKNGVLYFSKAGAFYKYDHSESASRAGEGTLWGFHCDGASMIVEHPANVLSLVSDDGSKTPLSSGLRVRSIAITQSGDIYALASALASALAFAPDEAQPRQPRQSRQYRQLWLLRAGREPQRVDEGFAGDAALSVSGDGNWLAAFEHDTTRGTSFRIERDGALNFKQTFYVLHKPDEADSTQAADAVADRSQQSYQYVATNLGVQICDANGRSGAILPLPGNAPAVSLCFGGKDFKTLYVLDADGRIHARPLRPQGAQPFLPPAPIKVSAG